MEIQELGTKPKEILGSGIEHQIFASRTNPNVIFKVGLARSEITTGIFKPIEAIIT